MLNISDVLVVLHFFVDIFGIGIQKTEGIAGFSLRLIQADLAQYSAPSVV